MKTRGARVASAVTAGVLVLATAACGGEQAAESPDSGAVLTLWTRAATEQVSKAYADAYNATEDTPLTVAAAAGVLDNDTDTEDDALTAAIVAQATNGRMVSSGK